MPNIAQGRWNNIGPDDDDDDDDEKGKVRLTHETGRQTGGGGGGGFVSVRVGSAAASIHEQLRWRMLLIKSAMMLSMGGIEGGK
jgi:hypothetical protein